MGPNQTVVLSLNPPDFDTVMNFTARESHPLRPRKTLLAVSMLATAACVVVILVIAQHHTPPEHTPPAAAPTGASLPSTTPVNATGPCDSGGCSGFDRLAVAAGVDDFYIGPAVLGTPQIDTGLFYTLVRCVTLSADTHDCTEVEGMAGVNPASYPQSGIKIGTTFTTITPAAYAVAWGPTKGGGTTTATTVARARTLLPKSVIRTPTISTGNSIGVNSFIARVAPRPQRFRSGTVRTEPLTVTSLAALAPESPTAT